MVRPISFSLLLVILVTSSLCQAQTLIDSYGFYRSWKELNDRYFANEVQLDERGLEPGTDTDTSKLSDRGIFRVSVKPDGTNDPVQGTPSPPFNQIHSWLISVQPMDGTPPSDLTLEFYGGMPLHNHGFPTAPIVARGVEPGTFHLHGIKFSMTGWWQFAFAIRNAETLDTIRINLVIEP